MDDAYGAKIASVADVVAAVAAVAVADAADVAVGLVKTFDPFAFETFVVAAAVTAHWHRAPPVGAVKYAIAIAQVSEKGCGCLQSLWNRDADVSVRTPMRKRSTRKRKSRMDCFQEDWKRSLGERKVVAVRIPASTKRRTQKRSRMLRRQS